MTATIMFNQIYSRAPLCATLNEECKFVLKHATI
uniref:Uncharacterized protein n=1 Tax=Rhizophora mucronata TaxID=61149 RepID=A0A2P2N196_RHIMU